MKNIIRECTFGEALFILLGTNDDSFEKDFQIPENELKDFLNEVQTNSKEIIFNSLMCYDLEISDKILSDNVISNADDIVFDADWKQLFIEDMNAMVKFTINFESNKDFAINIIETPNKVFAFKGYF